jgi:hypothetical protein
MDPNICAIGVTVSRPWPMQRERDKLAMLAQPMRKMHPLIETLNAAR